MELVASSENNQTDKFNPQAILNLMNSVRDQSKSITVAGGILSAAMLLGLLGSVAAGISEFSFRDTASYYAPIYQWVADQRLDDKSSYWNPNDNWGGPVLADGTPGIYYPPQLLFLLQRVFPFSSLLGFFVAIHVALAISGVLAVGHAMELQRLSRWVAAMSFAFGGSLLFQTCNLVYLISAAWLPWALAAVIAFTIKGHWVHVGQVAICMAAMVLAGDPQMAFHVSFIAGVAWMLSPVFERWQENGPSDSSRLRLNTVLRGIAGLIVVATAAIGMSLVQLGPSYQWSQSSERTAIEGNESATGIDSINKAFQRPEPGTHRDAIYQFSLPPWSLTEMVCPNALGKMDYGLNTRWSSRLPGSDRIWIGSLYSGAFVFLLALISVFKRLSQSQRFDRFLSVGALFFIVASFGWYGLGWLFNELNLMRGGSGLSRWIGEPVGGLYWMMENVIPGYGSFRYPAKLFVVGNLFLCLLAGRGLDRCLRENVSNQTEQANPLLPLVQRFSFWLAITFGAAAAVVWACFVLLQFGSARPTSSLIPALSKYDLVVPLLHTSVSLGLFHVALRCWRNHRTVVGPAILLLLSLDLWVANGWQVSTNRIDDQSTQETQFDDNMTTLFRSEAVNDYSALPNSFDLKKQLNLDRLSLYPKHHLDRDIRVVGSFHSIQPLDTATLLQAMNGLNRKQLIRACQALSIASRMMTAAESVSAAEPPFVLESLGSRPRFYIAEQWQLVSPINSQNRSEVIGQTEDFLQWCQKPANVATDPLNVWIESDSIPWPDPIQLNTAKTPSETNVQLVQVDNDRVELSVRATQPSVLVAADYFHTDWKASIIFPFEEVMQEVQMLRVNRLLRGIPIPAGEFRVVMEYKPPNSRIYFWISCLAWASVLLSMLALRRQAP